MKTFLLFAALCLTHLAQADDLTRIGFNSSPTVLPPPAPPIKGEYRTVNGRREWTLSNGWYRVFAKVVEVRPEGIRLEGNLTHPVTLETAFRGEFFMTNFPATVAEGDSFGDRILLAKDVGIYQYESAIGYRTFHKLDFGRPWIPAPPPALTPQQAAASRSTAEQKRLLAAAKTLQWHIDLAGQGDPFGQLSMGLRYLNGDGVPQDKKLAREYLVKSAAQGNAEAKTALAKLPAE